MRRMATNKQLDYINDLHEVAEKVISNDRYPEKIVSQFEWDESLDNCYPDFENHELGSVDLVFDGYDLFNHYGLHGYYSDEISFITYTNQGDQQVSFPESINNYDDLVQWLLTPAGITAILNSGAGLDTTSNFPQNSVAEYDWVESQEIHFEVIDGKLYLTVENECVKGEGEEIVEASEPYNHPALSVENLEVDNLQAENLPKIKKLQYGYEITIDEGEENPICLYLDFDSDQSPRLWGKSGYGDQYISFGDDDGDALIVFSSSDNYFRNPIRTDVIQDIEEINAIELNDGEGSMNINSDEDLYITAGGNALTLASGGSILLPGLITSDPHIEGALWNDNGVLKISSGE